MTNNKYELIETDERPLGPSVELFRIRALRDIGTDVKAGDMGGLIGGPGCLYEPWDCWVYPDAIVCKGAKVMDAATVRGRAIVIGNAILEGHARIDGDVQIFSDINMSGDDVLEGKFQIVALPVAAQGHYALSGHTRFCFQCDLGDSKVHFELQASSCVPGFAARLATVMPGQKLAYLQKQGEIYPVEVRAHGRLRLQEVKATLENIANDSRWATRYPLNVVHLS